ncbi:MAG: DUF4251 domain-containing protein [Prevotella sp.]
MKHLLIIIAVCCLAACATTKTAEQKAAETRQKTAQLMDSLDNRTYSIDFNYVIPRRMSPRFLSSIYSVRVEGDSIFSALPYFGVAYRADLGSRDRSPLDFESAISQYESRQVKKNKVRVKLKTNNDMDYLTYNFDFFTNGKVSLNIIATDRESITFTGEMIFKE